MIWAIFINADGTEEDGYVPEGNNGMPPRHWDRHEKLPSISIGDLLTQRAIPPSLSVLIRRYRLRSVWRSPGDRNIIEADYVEEPCAISHPAPSEETSKES